MGVQPLEQVTVPAPHWTTFPALHITGVDWGDHNEAHHAVMRLFARNLAGPVGRRRATNDILFRYDHLDGVPTILVQSSTAPELLPTNARCMWLAADAWALPDDTTVEFRVAVNPVRRFHNCTRVVADDEFPNWLAERLDGALTDVTVLNTVTRVTHASHGQQKLTVKTIDAVGRVANADRFAALRHHGVGRSKSYGAGLLTARAIG